jgi:hypothetical protein
MDSRQQELEKDLLEARVANARLMEDNESYQLLLSEKTLSKSLLAEKKLIAFIVFHQAGVGDAGLEQVFL